MNKTKITAFILASLMLFTLITSCAKPADDSKGDSNGTTQQQDNNDAEKQDDASDTTDEVRLLPNVPEDLNLDGYKFRILYNFKDPATSGWGVRGIESAEETGDAVNDATYRRNAAVTEKYNFEIIGQPETDSVLSTAFVKKLVQSGSDEFDVIIMRQTYVPSLITAGSFVDFNTIPNINFDSPWWDQGIMNQMSLDNKQFAAFGDLIVGANDALRILMFNKKLHQDAGLEDIYALVREGKWTLDKFYDMSKTVSADLNGDGARDNSDQYGILMQTSSLACFMFGAGESVTSKDADDMPVLTMGSERSLLVLQKVHDILYTPDMTLYDSAFTDTHVGLQAAFENNQGLFYGEVLELAERMRATQTDFGVLPYPKYDESQTDYYAFADSWCMNHIFIPTTNQNLEKTGQILEILNAEAYYTSRPAYYEKSLNGKFIRDKESTEMLDIILANKIISQDELYNWGMYTAVKNALNSKSANFASAIEKVAAKTTTSIEKTINLINNMG